MKKIENAEVLVNENDEILVSQLMQSLKNYGIRFENALISILSKEETYKGKGWGDRRDSFEVPRG